MPTRSIPRPSTAPFSMSRNLGGLAADDADARLAGALGQRAAELCEDLGVGVLDGDVVEHGDGLGADADQVVDVHRHAVDADRVVALCQFGDQQLGADPVRGERQLERPHADDRREVADGHLHARAIGLGRRELEQQPRERARSASSVSTPLRA